MLCLCFVLFALFSTFIAAVIVFQIEEQHLYQGNVTFDFWSICFKLYCHQ